MAVAKSYEDFKIVGEPFDKDGKPYVKVVGPCPRCGGSGHYSYNQMDGTRCYGCNGRGLTSQIVRWYTDKERAAQDRAAERRKAATEIKKEQRRVQFAARNAFGLGKDGFITILVGDYDTINTYVHEDATGKARYANMFGWYFPSEEKVENVPDTVKTIRIEWDAVRDENDPKSLTMKDNDFVKKYIRSLTSEPSNSTFQGTIGEWLEKTVTVKKNITLDGRYGTSHMHIMEDEVGNVYVWTTASKSKKANDTITLRMKVKDHKEYEGVQQTVVYYCKEVRG